MSKFYLTNSDPSATPSTWHGTWNTTASGVTKILGEAPSGAGPTTVADSETSSTDPYSAALGRWISEPLTAQTAFASGDTWTAIFGALESNASANMSGKAYIWVWQTGTADTSRGNLVVDVVDSVEWPTTATGVEFNNSATNALADGITAEVDDRIVVEFGYSAANSATTSFIGTMWYGGSDTDLTEGGDETTLSGWVSFTTAVASPSLSPSTSASPSLSPSASPSLSPSASVSPSLSPSSSVSPSASTSPSLSPSSSASPSLSPSSSVSPSASESPSLSPSSSASPSLSPSSSVSPSASTSPSLSPSASVSPSASESPSLSPSASTSPSLSPSSS